MSRWVTSFGYLMLALPLAAACGGNVVGDGSRDVKETAPSPGSSAPVASQEQGHDNPDGDVDLGDCTLGPAENRATDNQCAWVADDRCYQTREMACNCACPRTRNSQCASGFEDGPDGHVWVSCH
jgi:hypothetical protein